LSRQTNRSEKFENKRTDEDAMKKRIRIFEKDILSVADW